MIRRSTPRQLSARRLARQARQREQGRARRARLAELRPILAAKGWRWSPSLAAFVPARAQRR